MGRHFIKRKINHVNNLFYSTFGNSPKSRIRRNSIKLIIKISDEGMNILNNLRSLYIN